MVGFSILTVILYLNSNARVILLEDIAVDATLVQLTFVFPHLIYVLKFAVQK